MPIPSPPSSQPRMATQTGTVGTSTAATTAIPATRNAKPAPTRRRLLQVAAMRAWNHAPAVQDTVDAVTAIPATTALWPRAEVSSRGTKVSAPKKENVSRPRARTAAGRPGKARNVPTGRRRRSGRAPTSPAAMTRPIATSGERLPRPARVRPVPSATRIASTVRPGALAMRPGGPRLSSGGIAIAPAPATRGIKPRKTQRHPSRRATKAAMLGPTSPGTIQAVARMARTRARRESS